jgi:hypothetical protein
MSNVCCMSNLALEKFQKVKGGNISVERINEDIYRTKGDIVYNFEMTDI